MLKNDKYVNLNLENAEALRSKIKQESESEIQALLIGAKNEAAKIKEEAQAQAASAKEQAFKESDAEISTLKDQIFSVLNIEKKRMILEEKNNFIKVVLSTVKEKAKEFRASKDYQTFLINTVVEALSVIDEAKLNIFYSKLDASVFNEDFIKKIKETCLAKTGKNISFVFQKGNFDDIGILTESNDGRLLYDNRFLTRLERNYDAIYMQLLREMK